MIDKKVKRLVIYGYAIELIFAVLIEFLVWMQGWADLVAHFIDKSASLWMTVFIAMLAGAMAARLVFFSLNSGDFSAWLEWRGLSGIVARAFVFNLILFFLVVCHCIAIVYIQGTWISHFGVFTLTLGLINFVTFSLFVYGLSRLQSLFNYQFKKESESKK